MFPNPKKARIALWVSMLIVHYGFPGSLLNTGNNPRGIAAVPDVLTTTCSSVEQAGVQRVACTICFVSPLTIIAYIPAIHNICDMELPVFVQKTTAGTTYEILAQHCFYRKKSYSVKRIEENDQSIPKA